MTDPDKTLVPGDVTVESKHEGDTAVQPGRDARRSLDDFKSSVKDFAQKIPDSIGRALESLQARVDAIPVQVDADTLKKIDALVEAGVFASRGESAAYLIHEGIKARTEVFNEIQHRVEQIEKLRKEIHSIVVDEPKEA